VSPTKKTTRINAQTTMQLVTTRAVDCADSIEPDALRSSRSHRPAARNAGVGRFANPTVARSLS